MTTFYDSDCFEKIELAGEHLVGCYIQWIQKTNSGKNKWQHIGKVVSVWPDPGGREWGNGAEDFDRYMVEIKQLYYATYDDKGRWMSDSTWKEGDTLNQKISVHRKEKNAIFSIFSDAEVVTYKLTGKFIDLSKEVR